MIFKNDNKTIPVVEHFGPTIQGEGMVVGQKTYFVRMAGCDYSCDWCDSKFSWDGSVMPTIENGLRKTPQELADEILANLSTPSGKLNCKHITLSGGNPAVQGALMADFINIMKLHGFKFSVETQGTIFQKSWFPLIDQFVLSPKPESSLMKTDWTGLHLFVERLQELKVNYSFKIVIMNDDDFEYLRKIIKEFPNEPIIYASVGNPTPYVLEAVSPMLIGKLAWLWDKVIAEPEFNNVRPLPQTHVLVYENKRGV